MQKRASGSKIIDVIVKAGESKKAYNPVVLDIRKQQNIFDYLVIMGGESTPQLKAIIEEVKSKVKDLRVASVEGKIDSGWMILDLGDIVVHVMSEEERAFYDLEGLWGKEAIVYHGGP